MTHQDLEPKPVPLSTHYLRRRAVRAARKARRRLNAPGSYMEHWRIDFVKDGKYDARYTVVARPPERASA